MFDYFTIKTCKRPLFDNDFIARIEILVRNFDFIHLAYKYFCVINYHVTHPGDILPKPYISNRTGYIETFIISMGIFKVHKYIRWEKRLLNNLFPVMPFFKYRSRRQKKVDILFC